MPKFGKDLFKHKWGELVDKLGGNIERRIEEADEKFDQLCSVLMLYADESGGTFNLGVDERCLDPEFGIRYFPLSYFSAPRPGSLENESRREVAERFGTKASVKWQFKNFEIRFDVFMMHLSCRPIPGPTSRVVPPFAATCTTNPKKAISLSIYHRSYLMFAGTTGQTTFPMTELLLPLYDKIVSRRVQSSVLEGKYPVSTYYCPFSDKGMEEHFILRSSNVRVGSIFAEDLEIARILIALDGFVNFWVGSYSTLLNDGYNISVMANPGPNIEQVRLLHQLMVRALNLLEESGVIGAESLKDE